MDSARHFRETEPAVLLFAHGSTVAEANEGVHKLAARIQESGTCAYVWASFLGPGQPELGTTIAEAAEAGFRRVVVIPYFLTLGMHLRRDLPRLVAAEKRKCPHLDIQVGRSLEGHPEMASLILSRIREVEVTEEARISA